ncbi:MAG: putative Ig domain-containing protein [Pseudomonadota bacterium]
MFSATATFDDGTGAVVPVWSQSSTYADITPLGVLTTKSVAANQNTTITAQITINGVTKNATKVVTLANSKRVLQSLAINGATTSIGENATAQYSAVATYDDGTADVTSVVKWAEDNAFVSVSAGGLLTTSNGVTSNQSITLIATYTLDGVTRSAKKVIAFNNDKRIVKAVAIDGPSILQQNTTSNYSGTAIFDDGYTVVIPIWSLAKISGGTPTYATISATGAVTTTAVTTTEAMEVRASYTYSGVTVNGAKPVTVTLPKNADRLVTRVSVDGSGVQGNAASDETVISANGRYVIYSSTASNLVSGDTNGFRDIFMYDRRNNSLKKITHNLSGGATDGNSSDVAVSGDGHFVVFASDATQLVASDANALRDIFVYDRDTDSYEKISNGVGGVAANGNSYWPSISNDGRYVAFVSEANNLVSGDTNAARDAFVFDRNTGVMKRIGSLGGQNNGASGHVAVSGDGQYVVFESDATNLVSSDSNGVTDVFLYNNTTGAVKLISRAIGGAYGNAKSSSAAIDSSGRYAAFVSSATNLVTGDTNSKDDIFIYDIAKNALSRVSTTSAGTEANGNSASPKISKNGKFVVFTSDATNLVTGDTNATTDIFVKDISTATTERASVTYLAAELDGASNSPSITDDGRIVAFASAGKNLVQGDTNAIADVFVKVRSESLLAANVWLEPVDQYMYQGKQFAYNVYMDFSDDPTLGGGINIGFDNTKVQYISFLVNPQLGADPALARQPDSLTISLNGLGFGNFDGLWGPSLIGTVTFSPIAQGTANFTVAENAQPLGRFYSVRLFSAQTVKYTGANMLVEAFVDSDGDGVADAHDAFPNNALEWSDRDGDGVGDNSDAFPDDPTKSVDNPPVYASLPDVTVNPLVPVNFTVSASDPDGYSVLISETSLPTGATFVNNVFNWTPSSLGDYNAIFSASDGAKAANKTVVIHVVSSTGNRAPTISTIAPQSVNEGATLTFTVSATDPDGTIPTVTATGLPTGATFASNTFTWTPTFAQAGSFSVTINATDGSLSASQVVSITVNNVNRAPTITTISPQTVNESALLTFTVSASDPDSTTPTLTATGLPTGASFTGNVFSWTPTYTQSGSYSVLFTASDGSLTATATASITVNNVNRAPTITAIPAQTVNEGSLLTFTISASDPDGTIPTITATGLSVGAALSGNTFTWTPSYTQAGSYSVTFMASDGSLSASTTASITVNNVNQAPVIVPISAKSVVAGSLLTFTVSASDPDGTTPTVTATGLPTGATFASNVFNWTPTTAQAGVTYNVTFTASDGSQTASAIVSITVTTSVLTTPPDNFAYAKLLPLGASSFGKPYIDSNNNKYEIVDYRGSVVVDLDPGTDTVMRVSQARSAAVIKHRADGTYAWSWDMGYTSGNNGVTGVAVDSAGNVYISGYFIYTQDFNPGAAVDSRTSSPSGYFNSFVTKLDANGAYLWTRTLTGTSHNQAGGLAIDAQNNLYLMGEFAGTLDLDPNAGVSNKTALGTQDVYVTKWDSNGNYVWARNIGAAGQSTGSYVDNYYEPWTAMQIRVGGGKVYVVGQAGAAIDLDTTAVGGEFSVSGNFIAAYDTTTNVYKWGQVRTSDNYVPLLALDSQGNAVLASYTGNVVKLGTNAGLELWNKTLSGPQVKGLGVDAQDNIYMSGVFWTTVDFNPDPAVTATRTAGGNDAFIVKWATDGTYGWVNVVGDSSSMQEARSLAIGPTGDLLVNIGTWGTMDLDPGANVATRAAGTYQVLFATDPTIAGDRDNDGIPDAYESLHGLSVTVDNGLTDADGDGLSDYQEYVRGTDPQLKDTDGDGMHDYYEVVNGLNPLDRLDSSGDINGNGIANITEYQASPAAYTVTRLALADGCNAMSSANAADGTTYVAGYTGSGPNYTNSRSCLVAIGSDYKVKWRYDYTNNMSWFKDVQVDALGNVYATGDNNNNGQLTKFTANGVVVWSYSYFGSYRFDSDSVAVDGVGNTYFLQHFTATTTDFDPGTGVVSLTKYGNQDLAITKLDSNGAHVWSKNIGAAGGGKYGQRIRVVSGKLYVTGTFWTATDLNPAVAGGEATSSGTDHYVAQYDAVTGAYIWSYVAGNGLDDWTDGVTDMVVDGTGNVYITGAYQGTVNFNRAGTDTRTAVYNKDLYVTKLNTSGAYQWTYAIGGNYVDVGTALALDANGNLMVLGKIWDKVDFDASVATDIKGVTNATSAFMMRLSASGGYLGSELLGFAGTPRGYSATGTSYTLSGSYQDNTGVLDLDAGPGRQETIWSSGGFVIRKEVLTR